MSSRTRMMGAGNATSTNYKTNVNLNTGGGSKKQGITSRVGLDNWGNLAIQTYSNGYGRNKLFVMNQLGGVGAGQSMFNGRFRQVDGVHSANNPSYYDTDLKINKLIQQLIRLLRLYPAYVNASDPYMLALVGVKESFRSDLIIAGFPELADEAHARMIHFETENDIPLDIPNRDKIITIVNYLNELIGQLPAVTNGIDFGYKTLALVPTSTGNILKGVGFGLTSWNGLPLFDISTTPPKEIFTPQTIII